MLNALQKQNFSQMFEMMDMNKDGVMNWDDYERVLGNFARELGLAAGSPEYTALRDAFMVDWELLKKVADTNGDGNVHLSEFLAYHEGALSTKEGYQIAVTNVAQMIIGLIDFDRDGNLDLPGYGILLKAFDRNEKSASAAFGKLDRDGDGKLSTEELMMAVDEYVGGTDANSIGQWLWGGPA